MATTEPPPLITECPNCHTRFRVGESQLQIAHGRVRCGACLAVFAGVDHLLLDDTTEVPELPSETNMLESVLAELAEEENVAVAPGSSARSATSESLADVADHGVTAARAFELSALAARRSDSPELDALSELLMAEDDERSSRDQELAEDADWTSVAVDTQEFPPRVARDTTHSIDANTLGEQPDENELSVAAAPKAAPRASIEDALNNEEALRWWLEDELPGNDDALAASDDDSMVVQLSQLDAVRDDELDLQALIATPESESKGQLEALFRELREDGEATEGGDADDEFLPSAAAAVTAKHHEQEKHHEHEKPHEQEARPDEEALLEQAASSEAKESTSEQALRQVVADLKADSEPTHSEIADLALADLDIEEPVSAVEAAKVEAVAESVADGASSSERSAAELHEAMDEVEPLVTRAMASTVLAASANKVAATEREAEAEQAMERELVAQKASATALAEENKSNEDTGELSGRLTTGSGVELVEPPPERQAAQSVEQASWNSTSFPATPPELVADITAEMAAAGKAEPADSEVGDDNAVKTALTGAKATFERLLGNPYALRVGTILASVLFVGQVMFWQFDDWAKSPTLRPVYAVLCTVVGCELPLRRSVQDMQSRKLAVRSHPDKANKLLVDALIINEAEFAQPFPVIELQFMDLKQQVVRSYTLEPGSYLDGELAGSNALMAVRTPVHIDIEIVDPGPTAVNYQLQFR